MKHPRSLPELTLHVFEQDGGWHWGITIERPHGTGKKVVAFSENVFRSEAEAHADGKRLCDCEDEASLRRSLMAPPVTPED
ncbi:hypothetical protein [Paraburkholderia solisilvae]|uniref:Uncharacterized protein n=1 Tax=Paraburkholderia solisilvae TaxID=624376 RepID=A0A6J5E5U5_9BURK|nr:hypothetical protein [Paraburkholderia solisilvae]CAB3761307.1 hypothetical protein LMG29739_03597 [Paraburkholderia solisilvae]